MLKHGTLFATVMMRVSLISIPSRAPDQESRIERLE